MLSPSALVAHSRYSVRKFPNRKFFEEVWPVWVQRSRWHYILAITQKAELAVMEEENQVATCSRSFLNSKPPKILIDKTARDEWKRICLILKEMSVIGDLDIYALVGYCNSWSLYCRATTELAQQPLSVESGKANPLVNVQIKYANEMRAFAVKAGISVNARLTYASLQVKDTDNEINNEFGL